MVKEHIIKKELVKNGIEENEILEVETDKTIKFWLHLQKILTVILCNFFLVVEVEEEQQIDFIKHNFREIRDIVITEIKIVLHNLIFTCDEELAEEVELNNKDETLLLLAIQEQANSKLKNLKVERKETKWI